MRISCGSRWYCYALVQSSHLLWKLLTGCPMQFTTSQYHLFPQEMRISCGSRWYCYALVQSSHLLWKLLTGCPMQFTTSQYHPVSTGDENLLWKQVVLLCLSTIFSSPVEASNRLSHAIYHKPVPPVSTGEKINLISCGNRWYWLNLSHGV